MIKFKALNNEKIILKSPVGSQTSRISELMHGFPPGHLNIIAGNNACGKSMFALNIAIAANMLGRNTIIASSEGNVEFRLNKRFKNDDWKKIDNLQIMNIDSDVSELSRVMKQQRSLDNPLVMVIDNLQMIRGHEPLSHAMQLIKRLSISENASVFITQSTNRAPSGVDYGIPARAVYAADMIISILSDSAVGKMSLRIDKNRMGSVSDLRLDYDPDNSKVW